MRCTLLLLVTLIACRDKAPPPPPPPPPPHDGVTLVQPGVPPLQPLRYHLTKGATTTSELVCDVDITSDEQRGPMPTLVVELETTVEDVLGDGSAKLRIAVIGTSVRERAGSAVPSAVMQAQAAAMRGVVITQTLAPDGAVSDAHVIAPEAPRPPGASAGSGVADAAAKASGRLDQLLRSLARMAMRFPAEPVGAGATWRERRTLPEGGIRAVSEITYTLTSVTGSTLVYAGTGQATGPAQTVEQDGAKIEIADAQGRSEVKGSVDLARYAVEATATSTFSSTMTVIAPDAGPGADRSTIAIAMTFRLAPASVPDGAGSAEAPSIAMPAAPNAGPSPGGDTARSPAPEEHGAQ
jgi:hypothetical protein